MFFLIFTTLINIFMTPDTVFTSKYNTGVNYYNNGEYAYSTAIFYSLWLKNPINNTVKNSLSISSNNLSIKPPTTLKYFLIPFKKIFLYIHILLLIIGILFFSIILFFKKKISIKTYFFCFTLILFSLLSILTFYNLSKLENINKVYLLENISLKMQPTFGSDITSEIRKGSVLKIIEERGNWIKIENINSQGWTNNKNVYYL